MAQNRMQHNIKMPRWALVLCGLFLAEAAAVGLAYYWRVFYDLDRRGVSGAWLTLACCAVGAGLYAAIVFLCRFVKSFDARCALCIFLCGVLFVFADPPMQPSDETAHYLRAYSISMGRFDFDASRGYPASVDSLISAFPGAWVTAHTSRGVLEVQTDAENQTDEASAQEYYSTQGYALKQYGENGRVESIADGYADYFSEKVTETAQEPLNFMILPYLPAALGMAIVRLFGLAALGCLYAGRLVNLAVYAILCYMALRGCKRYKPVFLAVMLLPMSLYMAASLNYDAILLGCYYLAASYYCREELTDQSLVGFIATFLVINAIKPWINLLWIAVPLMLPRTAWKTRLKKWQAAALCAVAALGVNFLVEWYGGAFRYHYGEIGRMLDDVAQIPQLQFVLSNPVRYLAVMLGTLYENNFFVGQLGVFGAMDLPITAINLLSPMALVFGAALSVKERAKLKALPAAGLGGLAVVYAAGAITAMYITYTPVGMVRVIGLQARYFLPCFLMFGVLLAALLSHLLGPREDADEQGVRRAALGTFAAFGGIGAILLMQHYFIGPVCLIG